MLQIKLLFIFFIGATFLFFLPISAFAQNLNDIPLGSNHRGTVVNESVTKTETKEIKEEVLEQGIGGGSDETIDTISQESPESQKNIFVIIGETVARVVETILPFLKNEPSAEVSPKVADLIIHSLVGAISPPLNMVRIFQDSFRPQVISKPKTGNKPSVTPQPTNIPSLSNSSLIDNTRKNLDISPKKFEGLPINKEIMTKSLISQYPDDLVVAGTHLNNSSIDIAVDSEKELRATMDGTVTITTDKVGNGYNTYPYRDSKKNKIVYYNNDGTPYYKCEAGDKLSDYSVCNKRTYGIYAVLVNDKNPNEKYKVIYAHLSSSTFEHLLMKTDKRSGITFQVKKGDLIGYSDNAGFSSGPHLHYEVFVNGKSVLSDNKEGFEKCLNDTNQTIEVFAKSSTNNICLKSWYNYNKANLLLIGIDLEAIKEK